MRRLGTFAGHYPFVIVTVAVLIAVGVLRLSGVDPAARWAASVFALAVAAYLTVGMVRDILRGHWGIDILAVTAIASTVAVGEYLAALVVVLMVVGGEALEDYAGGRARRELSALLERAPQHAHRIGAGGQITEIPAGEVGAGDLLLIKPAEVVPVDAILVSGAAAFDESSLTGESLPVERISGDTVMSGSVNGDAAVQIRATATASDSQYSKIVALVREASASRAPMVRLADRYAVPFTAIAYVIAGLGWAISRDPVRFAEVLVVATPCPLLIAAPVAFIGGMSRAAHGGVIVKGGATLEQLSRIRTAAFDKTGTLTQGHPALDMVNPAPAFTADEVLTLAASAEQYSSHVLAGAVIEAARQRGLPVFPASDATEAATNGVQATVQARSVLVGKPTWVAERAAGVVPADLDGGGLAIYVAVDGRFAGTLTMSDPVRENAGRTISRLRAHGVGTILMLTGDVKATARHIAGPLGITDVRAELLPADKVAAVAGITERPVMMVGDGVNDAPVLAAADVGVAMGARGSTAASESADVVIMLDDVSRTATAVSIGKHTTAVALQSIWIGIALSVGLMIVAAFGVIPAIVGALLQEAVDLATILNALRALRPGRAERAVRLVSAGPGPGPVRVAA